MVLDWIGLAWSVDGIWWSWWSWWSGDRRLIFAAFYDFDLFEQIIFKLLHDWREWASVSPALEEVSAWVWDERLGDRRSVISDQQFAISHFPSLIDQVISCLQLSAFVWRLRSQFPAPIQCDPNSTIPRRISNYISEWSLHLSGWRSAVSAVSAVHNFNLTKHIRLMALLIGAVKLGIPGPQARAFPQDPHLPSPPKSQVHCTPIQRA